MSSNHLWSSTLLSVLVFALIILGLLSLASSESVITLTQTTMVTLPPTTLTTTVELAGGTQTLTLVVPGYKIIQYYEEPDVICIVTFRMIERVPPQTVTVGGTAISIPGTTISTVMSESVWTISTEYLRPGWTTTYTGYGGEIPVKIVIGEMTMTVTMPAYGEFREACGSAKIRNIVSFILDKVPATFIYAYEGTTISIPEYVYTIPGMTLEAEPFTTTYTSTMKGTTYTTTMTTPGVTMISTVVLPSTRYVSTIIKPGGTTVSYIYSTVTVAETTTPTRTETTTPPAVTTTPTTATQTQVLTTTTQPQPQAPFDYTLLIGIAAVIVIVGAAAVLLMRRKR